MSAKLASRLCAVFQLLKLPPFAGGFLNPEKTHRSL